MKWYAAGPERSGVNVPLLFNMHNVAIGRSGMGEASG